MLRRYPLNAAIVAAGALLAATPAVFATTSFDVSLDTAPLIGDPAGPYYLFLAFTDGSGVGDANNTVTLTSFSLGGGTAFPDPIVVGGASGDLGSGITITDSTVLNLLYQQFAAGTELSFALGLTSNDDTGGTPDRLTISLLDSSGNPIPTLAPGGADYFLGVDLHSSGPVFDVYGTDASQTSIVIPAPTLVAASVSPEPRTSALLGAGLAVLGWRRLRRNLGFRGQ